MIKTKPRLNIKNFFVKDKNLVFLKN